MSIPSGKELLNENLNGLSEKQLARKYGTTRATIHGRIYRHRWVSEKKSEEKNDNFDFTEEEKSEERDAEKQPRKFSVGESIGDNIVVKIDKNTGQIYCRSRSIKTLKQLLEVSQTDLSVWDVKSHVINKWDVTTSEGRTFENWQVKAWLIRKEPIDVFPDISPVVFPLSTLERPLTNFNKDIGKYAISRVMVVSDPHFGYNKNTITQELTPYHNEKNLKIALDIFADNDFDYLIWGGDILDCNEWTNHFIKRPEFRQTTQPAINEASRWIASFVKAKPQARHIVLKGNHDDRIETYIISNLDEIYNIVPGDSKNAEPLMSMSNLLGLARMGIEYLDEYYIGSTKFVHGDIARSGSGSTAKAYLDGTLSNTVFAHVHRKEMITETKNGFGDDRVEVFSMCPGCLCYTDGRVPGSEKMSNWQNGIGVLEFIGDKCITKHIIDISNNSASFFGKIYKA